MLEKICSRCLSPKLDTENNFRKFGNVCKKCQQLRELEIRHSLDGHLRQIFKTQISSSISRGHQLPNYSIDDLLSKYMTDPTYVNLFKLWKDSNFNKWLSPSLDRLNENLGYSFENIQMISWKQNMLNHQELKFTGIANYDSKQVSLYDMNGVFIETFVSLKALSREFDIHVGVISRCLSEDSIKMVTNKTKTMCFTLSTEEAENIEPYTGRYRQQFRRVSQYTMAGEFIGTFESSKLFMETRPEGSNKNCSNIYRVCDGKDNSAYGFKWQWFDEKEKI